MLDGGEQVTSVTLETARFGPIDPASLTTETFSVHAKATSPIPVDPGDQIFSEYDLDRRVTAARLDRHGNIVLELAYGEGAGGGDTLGYIVGKGRNVVLDLDYTITQNAPLAGRNGRSVTYKRFVQGPAVRPRGGRIRLPGVRLGPELPALLAPPSRRLSLQRAGPPSLDRLAARWR